MSNWDNEENYVKVHASQLRIWESLIYQAWLMIDAELDDTNHKAKHFSELATSAALMNDFLMRIGRFTGNGSDTTE